MSPQDAVIARFLLALAVIIMVSAAFAALARRLRQPAVVGEVIAGLALGPSLLGQLPGHPVQLLFPAEVRSLLSAIAQIGLVLFMFLIGFELDLGHVRGSGKSVVVTSAASVILPFGLGFALAMLLYSDHAVVHGHQISKLAFCLFIGTAMAITAFPVLARVIKDHGLEKHRLGVLAMLIAAVNDVVAWCLLMVVITIVSAGTPLAVAITLAGLTGYAALMVFLVRPLLRRLILGLGRTRNAEAALVAAIVVGVLVSSWATAAIGLHPVFGAFLFGALLPRREIAQAAPRTPERVGQLSGILLPVYFVITGLSVNISGFGWVGVAELAAAVSIACIGKFAAAFVARPATHLPPRPTVVLGALLNTRGLTELIVLGVGLQIGVLDGRIFTIMVLTAVITTVIAGPIVRRLHGDDAATARKARPRVTLPSDGPAV